LAFLTRWNKKPRIFKWRADPKVVLENILRARAALEDDEWLPAQILQAAVEELS